MCGAGTKYLVKRYFKQRSGSLADGKICAALENQPGLGKGKAQLNLRRLKMEWGHKLRMDPAITISAGVTQVGEQLVTYPSHAGGSDYTGRGKKPRRGQASSGLCFCGACTRQDVYGYASQKALLEDVETNPDRVLEILDRLCQHIKNAERRLFVTAWYSARKPGTMGGGAAPARRAFK